MRRCPCSRSPLNIGKPSHSISSSTERELLGSPLFPWIFRWDEEAIRLQYWRDLVAVEEQRREETRAGGSRNCFSHYSNFCVLQSESGGNLVSTFTFCRSLIKVKFYTDQFRPALGSCGCSIVDCRLSPWSKTWKLPYFRPFQPDNQILSALPALCWPSNAFYWPNTTK